MDVGAPTGPGAGESGGRAPEAPRNTTWIKLLALVAVAFVGYKLLLSPGPTKTDAPSEQHQQEVAQHPPLAAITLGAADVDRELTDAAVAAARAGQPIPNLPNAPDSLVRDIAAGKVEFFSILVYDNYDEDGDVVTVSIGNGIEYGPIQLTNGGMTITVPVTAGEVPRITLRAVTDGYPPNGVTCALKTSTGFWYSDILQPGQTQPIPFTAG
jgi:hypothetical protein